MPRIYQQGLWQAEQVVSLSADAASHVGRVLRMRVGESLTLFNGLGLEANCAIDSLTKREVRVTVLNSSRVDRESPLAIHLYQALSKGERMEMAIQKAVELGVAQITPLITTRCVVRLDEARLAKKYQQWQKIIIAACEQCGRNRLPRLNEAVDFASALEDEKALKLILDPEGGASLPKLSRTQAVALFIGPEGGFTAQELALSVKCDVLRWHLGPRVLRTETAALSAVSILQYCAGDLSRR